MSRLSHKHYLLLLCLRVGPTSGAKIACLLDSPTAYCERGGMRRQCWVALNHFEIVALVCQREKERRRQAPGDQERRTSNWEGWKYPFTESYFQDPLKSVTHWSYANTSEIIWFILSVLFSLASLSLLLFCIQTEWWNIHQPLQIRTMTLRKSTMAIERHPGSTWPLMSTPCASLMTYSTASESLP